MLPAGADNSSSKPRSKRRASRKTIRRKSLDSVESREKLHSPGESGGSKDEASLSDNQGKQSVTSEDEDDSGNSSSGDESSETNSSSSSNSESGSEDEDEMTCDNSDRNSSASNSPMNATSDRRNFSDKLKKMTVIGGKLSPNEGSPTRSRPTTPNQSGPSTPPAAADKASIGIRKSIAVVTSNDHPTSQVSSAPKRSLKWADDDTNDDKILENKSNSSNKCIETEKKHTISRKTVVVAGATKGKSKKSKNSTLMMGSKSRKMTEGHIVLMLAVEKLLLQEYLPRWFVVLSNL